MESQRSRRGARGINSLCAPWATWKPISKRWIIIAFIMVATYSYCLGQYSVCSLISVWQNWGKRSCHFSAVWVLLMCSASFHSLLAYGLISLQHRVCSGQTSSDISAVIPTIQSFLSPAFCDGVSMLMFFFGKTWNLGIILNYQIK